MMIDLAEQIADPARYGWKAHYLSFLVKEGFAVPRAMAIAFDEIPENLPVDSELAYAVRSSGIAEDCQSSSHAGHFTTHLGVRGAENLLAAVGSVRASGVEEMLMGVVIQEMVETPIVSGVAFSIHPVTLARDVAVVSWVRGLGDGLVSGVLAGNDVEFRLQDGTVSAGEWPLDAELLHVITGSLVRLQELLGRPIDIEWCVSGSGTVMLLQLRPIVLPAPRVISLDTTHSFHSLPRRVAAHSKLALRADAVHLGVPMSRARAFLATQPEGMPTVAPFPTSKWSAGRSVVLLFPTQIEGRIVREFTKDCSTDVEFFVRGCQRYAIRQYPDQSGAAQSIANTLQVGLQHSAIACVIEQEILHAYATGILRRTAEGYLAEVALGHFVPKGYVETSMFGLSNDLTVTLRTEVQQSKSYHFMNGHVIAESPPYESLLLTDADLQRLVCAMKPILEHRPAVALEFGLLGFPGELEPYMIDVADSDSDTVFLSIADATRGVVSAGTAAGRVIDLRAGAAREDLNIHLYNTAPEGGPELTPTIFIAHHASVDLLPIVRAAHSASGFIFERASLLAHLSVVLRERDLAAVTLPTHTIDAIAARSEWLTIDTTKPELVVTQEVPET
ncbi:PEP/pyruvate-binding domain-containing protein [Nocardia elegans]|uniref:PEP/pyruvate-binding domain-containing protein n=1 Tax=Nocardia elegans TaxID=300029 RepID=A0ABW6TJI6_9NOCA